MGKVNPKENLIDLKEYFLLKRHKIEKWLRKNESIVKYQLENWDLIKKFINNKEVYLHET